MRGKAGMTGQVAPVGYFFSSGRKQEGKRNEKALGKEKAISMRRSTRKRKGGGVHQVKREECTKQKRSNYAPYSARQAICKGIPFEGEKKGGV